MHKTITIFRNIVDTEKFQKLYLEQLLPELNNLPGSICTDVTQVSSFNTEMAGPFGPVQYMIETHFETIEHMNDALTSPRVAEHMMRALQETPGELFFFTGKTGRIYSDAAQKKFRLKSKRSTVADNYSQDKFQEYPPKERLDTTH